MEARADWDLSDDSSEPEALRLQAYCQHCDRVEVVAPEDIYSPEFNFWCPRCQNILILTTEDGQVVERDDDEVRRRQAPTRVDEEEPLPETMEDREPPPGRQPEPPTAPRRRDSYDAIAAELDANIFSEAREALRSTADWSRERPTERVAGEPEQPTRAWNESVLAEDQKKPGATVRAKVLSDDWDEPSSEAAASPDFPTTAWSAGTSSSAVAPLPTATDANIAAARETVRVRRPAAPPSLAQQLSEAISPGLPPLPNWDGGDTQHVRELADSVPDAIESSPVVIPEDAQASDGDDPLDQIAVVETRRGTGGLGSRTYERQDVAHEPEKAAPPEAKEAAAAAEAPAKPAAVAPAAPSGAQEPKPRPKTEDLDWYALIDEALPETQEPLSEDPQRVVIRLPESSAPKSDADAEQVRQLQATLEARGIEHNEQRFDPKLLESAAEDARDPREGTGKLVSPDSDTRRETSGFKADADAPTRLVAASSVPKEDPARKPDEEKRDSGAGTAKVDTGAVRSQTKSAPSLPSEKDKGNAAVVVESFDRADLDPGLVCVLDSSSSEADYFKQLYQRIFHSRNGSSPRTVLVTSARRGEGKTTVAANLAVVASRMPGGGALLVEADPRGGDLLRSFGVKKKFEGLLEALESRQNPQRYLIPFKLGYALHVLPLGIQGSNAAELISSDRIGEILRGLQQTYPNAVVIVDGSSVLHAPDPLAIARHVDGVVLVVRADDTPREQVERARDLLGPDKLLGVVLNHVAQSA